MPARETLIALVLLAAPLLLAAAGTAHAEDGDGATPTGGDGGPLGYPDFVGTHLTFTADGARLTAVRAGGAPFFDALTLTPGPAASSIEPSDGYGYWRSDAGAVLGTAVDSDSPGLRIRIPVNGSLTATLASGAAVIDENLPGTRVATSAGVALLNAPGATVSGPVDRLTWTFPQGGNLTLLFLLGDTPWTRASTTHDAAASLRVGGDATRQWLQASPPEAARLDAATWGERATVSLQLPADGEYHAVRVALDAGLLNTSDPGKVVLVAEMPQAPDPNHRENFGKARPATDLPEITTAFGPFYNLTRTATGWDLTVLLRGNGLTRLTLERDVAPPSLVGGPRVENVTHQTLLIYTQTTEWAFVEVVVEGGDLRQEHPTSVMSRYQTFPIQGLEPETTYAYTISAWDVAGNEQQVATGTFTTLARPVGPKPVVTSVFPSDKAHLSGAPAWVEAQFASPESPVSKDRVRIFVDLKEVPTAEAQGLAINDTHVRYAPPNGFGPGTHVVSVEVTNQAGETTSKRWTFTVAQSQETPAPSAMLAALAAAGAAAMLARRR